MAKNLIDNNEDASLFHDEPKVPVEIIAVALDGAEGLDRERRAGLSV